MNEAIVEKVKALIAAPSCYAGLKKIAEEYIAALGSDREKEAGRKLVAELEADVLSIDDVLAFFESDAGEKTFGAEQAAAYAAARIHGEMRVDAVMLDAKGQILGRSTSL